MYEKIISDLLNIHIDQIQKIIPVTHSDDSIELKIRLVPDPNVVCPICKKKVKIKGYVGRDLVHSTLVNRKFTIHYERRRYECKNCSHTFSEKNPFINTSESLTIETIINVLKELKYVNNTYTSTARRFNLSVTKVMHIFDKHVNIKRKVLPEVLSINEHYFPTSDQDALFICILMDFNTGTIIDVLPDRKKNYLVKYFSKIRSSTYDESIHKRECDNVKYVSIDMYDTYRDIASIFFPKALVGADPFHVLEHLTDAFRDVRFQWKALIPY